VIRQTTKLEAFMSTLEEAPNLEEETFPSLVVRVWKEGLLLCTLDEERLVVASCR